MDGGYYAIKGFEYQVDKLLLDIITCQSDNQEFYLEKIEDINTDEYVMQVKYKEAAKFYPSSIKKPVKQLLDLFRIDSVKKYKLYCYFSDLNGYDEKIAIKDILGKDSDKYSTSDLDAFRKNFELLFSKEFQDQFDEVIDEIKNKGLANSLDSALIVYSNLVDYLRKLVVNNDPTEADNRKCNRKVLFELVAKKRKILYDESLLIYLGRRKYLSSIKNGFPELQKKRHNFIFFGEVQEALSLSLKELIVRLVNKYYYRAVVNIKPLTFVVQDDISKNVKEHLINENIKFNDGYEEIGISEDIFYETPVINKKMAGNQRATDTLAKTSFKLRIISISTFKNLTECKIHPAMVYYFDVEPFQELNSSCELKIEKLDTSEIAKLFKLS